MLLGCKYRNRRAVAAHLGGVIVRRLRRQGTDVDGVTVVTWAPTTRARRRQRGFDQAELIARSVAAVLGVPCRRLLERTDAVAAQTGRTRAQRLSGAPQFAVRPGSLAAEHVLLVDDVVTTGATLRSAGEALRGAGVGWVTSAAVAATPLTVVERSRAA